MTWLASDQAEKLAACGCWRPAPRQAASRWSRADAGAGATTVALGLANALAMQGERVLLIDEDRFGARATRLAGAMPEGTLAAVLGGTVTLEAALAQQGLAGTMRGVARQCAGWWRAAGAEWLRTVLHRCPR
ncbi:hypothetical protein ACU4GD_04370 [Cupriavidus basilensis]